MGCFGCLFANPKRILPKKSKSGPKEKQRWRMVEDDNDDDDDESIPISKPNGLNVKGA